MLYALSYDTPSAIIFSWHSLSQLEARPSFVDDWCFLKLIWRESDPNRPEAHGLTDVLKSVSRLVANSGCML